MESGSVLALGQALEWARSQGMSIRGLLSPAELEQLAHVFAPGSGAEWSFALYEPLRAFAHALPRLGLPDAPAALHFGDVLVALNQILLRDADRAVAATGPYRAGLLKHAWPTRSVLSPEVFSELGYASTSSGIARLQEEQRAGWGEHAQQSKQFLLRAAELSTGSTAAVIGAGKLYDIPLRKLAERFERLVLIDVDGESLSRSVERVLGSSELRERVVLVSSDVTGINEFFVHEARRIFDQEKTEPSLYQGLLGLLYSYRWLAPPALGPAESLDQLPLDAVFSVMVLSQLAIPLTRYVEQGFAERFPHSSRLDTHEFQVALGQFTHRVQQAHLQALLGHGRVAAITSDVSEQLSQFAGAGAVSSLSPPLPLIGAPHLEDLLPARPTRLLASTEWQWQRIQPGPTRPRGRTLTVNGCAASGGPL